MNNKRAFTLIELLVVISIIGLLASIVAVAVNKTRIKARDVRRLSDARQMVTALEMYYDQEGKYPPRVNGTSVHWTCGILGGKPSWNTEFLNALKDFLPNPPVDPKNSDPSPPTVCATSTGYFYIFDPEHDCDNDSNTPGSPVFIIGNFEGCASSGTDCSNITGFRNDCTALDGPTAYTQRLQ